MPEIAIERVQRTITTYHLVFPELNQRMPVAIDRDTKEVFITPWFYPGGPVKCLQAANDNGEPLLALDKGYLISARFIRARQPAEKLQRAIDLLVESAEKALEEDRNAEASPDPEGYILTGPDKGSFAPMPGSSVH